MIEVMMTIIIGCMLLCVAVGTLGVTIGVICLVVDAIHTIYSNWKGR